MGATGDPTGGSPSGAPAAAASSAPTGQDPNANAQAASTTEAVTRLEERFTEVMRQNKALQDTVQSLVNEGYRAPTAAQVVNQPAVAGLDADEVQHLRTAGWTDDDIAAIAGQVLPLVEMRFRRLGKTLFPWLQNIAAKVEKQGALATRGKDMPYYNQLESRVVEIQQEAQAQGVQRTLKDAYNQAFVEKHATLQPVTDDAAAGSTSAGTSATSAGTRAADVTATGVLANVQRANPQASVATRPDNILKLTREQRAEQKTWEDPNVVDVPF